jgi:hypothetical protein
MSGPWPGCAECTRLHEVWLAIKDDLQAVIHFDVGLYRRCGATILGAVHDRPYDAPEVGPRLAA